MGATDRKLGLLQAAARCIADPRNPLLITHGVADMLRQRVYGLALGWEDLNDHASLRDDVAIQTAVGVDAPVASAPTLCRLEKWADRATAWRLHELWSINSSPASRPPPRNSCSISTPRTNCYMASRRDASFTATTFATGVWPARQQPALRGDQPHGRGPGALRRAVLSARRGRAPDQGGAGRSVCHAHELSAL